MMYEAMHGWCWYFEAWLGMFF